MSDRKELEEQVARLTALVEEMRLRMASLEGAGRPIAPEVPRSRRDILRLGGAAALGAVGAAALRAIPAAAANGDTLTAGNAFAATSATTITGPAAPGEVIGAIASDFSQTLLNATLTSTGAKFSAPLRGLGGAPGGSGLTATFADGVDGWATGASSFGVFGLSDSGVGVTGESDTGISLYAAGSGRILQDPLA